MASTESSGAAQSQSASSQMTIEQFGYKQELKRALSMWDLAIIGVMMAVPLAPFTMFGFLMDSTKGQVGTAYVLAGIMMLITANSYAWISSEFPLAGSAYSYTSRAASHVLGMIAGMALSLDYMIAPTGVYILSAFALSAVLPDVPLWIWVVAFVIINTLLNLRGIEFTATVNKIFFAWQLLVFLWFAGAVVVAATQGTGGATFSGYAFYRGPYFEPAILLAGVGMTIFTYLGIDGATTFAEEAKGGARTIGLGMAAGTIMIAVLFAAQAWLGTVVYPNPESFGDPSTSLYEAALIVGGPALQWVITVTLALALGITCAGCAQAAAARTWYGMSRDKLLPGVLSKVHGTYKTPWVGILVMAVIGLGFGVGMLNNSDVLFNCVSFGAVTAFFLVNASTFYYFIIKRKSKNYFFHGFLPLVGAVYTAYIWTNLTQQGLIVGLIWLALGLIYLTYQKFVRKVDVRMDALS